MDIQAIDLRDHLLWAIPLATFVFGWFFGRCGSISRALRAIAAAIRERDRDH